jgi:hypothetical protein
MGTLVQEKRQIVVLETYCNMLKKLSKGDQCGTSNQGKLVNSHHKEIKEEEMMH